jgi:hypothetical protein
MHAVFANHNQGSGRMQCADLQNLHDTQGRCRGALISEDRRVAPPGIITPELCANRGKLGGMPDTPHSTGGSAQPSQGRRRMAAGPAHLSRSSPESHGRREGAALQAQRSQR